MYNIETNASAKPRARAQNTNARYAISTNGINNTDRFLVTALFNANREIYVN